MLCLTYAEGLKYSSGKTEELAGSLTGSTFDVIKKLESAWDGFLLKLGDNSVIKGAMHSITQYLTGITRVMEGDKSANWQMLKSALDPSGRYMKELEDGNLAYAEKTALKQRKELLDATVGTAERAQQQLDGLLQQIKPNTVKIGGISYALSNVAQTKPIADRFRKEDNQKSEAPKQPQNYTFKLGGNVDLSNVAVSRDTIKTPATNKKLLLQPPQEKQEKQQNNRLLQARYAYLRVAQMAKEVTRLPQKSTFAQYLKETTRLVAQLKDISKKATLESELQDLKPKLNYARKDHNNSLTSNLYYKDGVLTQHTKKQQAQYAAEAQKRWDVLLEEESKLKEDIAALDPKKPTPPDGSDGGVGGKDGSNLTPPDSFQQQTQAIITGGKRTNHITIHIAEMGAIKINTYNNNTGETLEDMHENTKEALLRVLHQATSQIAHPHGGS